MFLKSISHKRLPILDMLVYMDSDKNRADENNLRVFHNLSGIDQKTIETDFIRNFSEKRKRVNGVKFYHEILSFSDRDTPYLSQNEFVLEDVVRRYIQLRCPTGVCYSILHKSDGHYHFHLCIGGGDTIEKGKALSISKMDLEKIKKEVELYHFTKYPEIQHSFCQSIVPEKGIKKDKQTIKELTITMRRIYEQALHKQDFIQRIEKVGYKTYKNGILIGDNKKIRYRLLGITKEELSVLSELDRLNTLREQSYSKGKTIKPPEL